MSFLVSYFNLNLIPSPRNLGNHLAAEGEHWPLNAAFDLHACCIGMEDVHTTLPLPLHDLNPSHQMIYIRAWPSDAAFDLHACCIGMEDVHMTLPLPLHNLNSFHQMNHNRNCVCDRQEEGADGKSEWQGERVQWSALQRGAGGRGLSSPSATAIGDEIEGIQVLPTPLITSYYTFAEAN